MRVMDPTAPSESIDVGNERLEFREHLVGDGQPFGVAETDQLLRKSLGGGKIAAVELREDADISLEAVIGAVALEELHRAVFAADGDRLGIVRTDLVADDQRELSLQPFQIRDSRLHR